MKISIFSHSNVLPDGTFPDRPGAVEVARTVLELGDRQLRVTQGWHDGIVEGYTLTFDNEQERTEFLIQAIEAAIPAEEDDQQ